LTLARQPYQPLRLVLAVLADEDAAPRADGDVVGPIELVRRARFEQQRELLAPRIVHPHLAEPGLAAARGHEVDLARVVPTAFPTRDDGCVLGAIEHGARLAFRVADLLPAHLERRPLLEAATQVHAAHAVRHERVELTAVEQPVGAPAAFPARRHVFVKAALARILRLVHDTRRRIDGDRLVGEAPRGTNG